MRLTIINQFYVPDLSPTANLAASLAEHRAARGDEVTVVASRGGYVPASRSQAIRDKQANPRVYRVWTPQLGKGSAIRRAIDYATFYVLATWRMLRLPRQDVIISLTTPPYITLAAFLHRLLHPRTRIIQWNMDSFPEGIEYTGALRPNSLPSRIMGRINRFMFRRLDRLVCLDEAMVTLCRKYESADRPLPAVVIPNWEKLSTYPANQTVAPWPAAKQLGLKEFVVLYSGNAGYGHQFDTVLAAADVLRNEPVTFLFVGGGKRWPEIEKQRQSLGLDNVVFHEYVPKEQTASVMSTAACALITLRDDALGINSPSKLHANLAMGLPILYVGPETSNVDAAIQKYRCGFSLRHGDRDGLVQAIRTLLNDPQLREQYRVAARAAFESAYCDERSLAAFDRIIDPTPAANTQPTGAAAAPETNDAPCHTTHAAGDGT